MSPLMIMGFESVYYVEIMTSFDAQKGELWPTVGYMELCVDRDLNWGRYLVLPSWQYLKLQNALYQAVFGQRSKSKLSLYCTADSATVAPFLYNSVATAITAVHFFQPSTAVQFIQSIQQHNLSLCCNCTAICAILSFTELYRNTSRVFPTFYHSSPNNSYCWHCGKPKSCVISLITSLVFDIMWQGWHVDLATMQ